MATGTEAPGVAEKKSDGSRSPKQYGTLIRVPDDFAEALRRAAMFEGLSMTEFTTLHLLPVVERLYRDAVTREARRLEGKDKG